MLITRFRQAKNKKGISLLEALAAVVITSILAAVLSMMIVPVLRTYNQSDTKVQLEEAVTARLNDIAMYLRGAKDIYLSTAKRNISNTWYNRTIYDSKIECYVDKDQNNSSNANRYFSDSSTSNYPKEADYVFPELRRDTPARQTEYDGVITCSYPIKRAKYGGIYVSGYLLAFVMDDYFARYKTSEEKKISGYLYPELVVAAHDGRDVPQEGSHKTGSRFLAYASYLDKKYQLSSDDYQLSDPSMYCPDNGSMYFLVKKNADNGKRLNALEIHLKFKKNGLEYEGTKTIVCENLMINNQPIHTVDFGTWEETEPDVWKLKKKSAVEGTKYYTVWFCPYY